MTDESIPPETTGVAAIPEGSIGMTTSLDPELGIKDPLSLSAHRRDTSKSAVRADHPDNHQKARKYYLKYLNRLYIPFNCTLLLTATRQNALIDMYLNAHREEELALEDHQNNSWKVKLAVNGSFAVNLFLFCIQAYAAISTGSLSLFATAADAFVSLTLKLY